MELRFNGIIYDAGIDRIDNYRNAAQFTIFFYKGLIF